MARKIKSLEEVSEEIRERIGEFKKFCPSNGYYRTTLRAGRRDIQLFESKIRADLSFTGTKQPISFGYFKSKKGYNTKYKNNKEFANHYGEYIAYIILKQLGKKACKVDLGQMEFRNPYSQKTFEVDGILSHYQLTQQEIFLPMKIAIEDYRAAHPKKYKELAEAGKASSEKNYTNIEIVLTVLEEYFRKSGQAHKIPEAKKRFFDMCIFDIKFANRDRHDENFGFRVDQYTGEIEFYHLFDNEQILGMQEDKKDVIKYLSGEREYKEFKVRELTSCIGIPCKNQKIDAMELLGYLLINYRNETLDSLEDIGRYQLSDLEELFRYFPQLSNEHKELAKKIFTERELEMSNIVKSFKQGQRKLDSDDEPSL